MFLLCLPSQSLQYSSGVHTLPPQKRTLEELGMAALISIGNAICRINESEAGRFFLDSGLEYM